MGRAGAEGREGIDGLSATGGTGASRRAGAAGRVAEGGPEDAPGLGGAARGAGDDSGMLFSTGGGSASDFVDMPMSPMMRRASLVVWYMCSSSWRLFSSSGFSSISDSGLPSR